MFSIIQVKAELWKRIAKNGKAYDVIIVMKDGEVMAIDSFENGPDIFKAAKLMKAATGYTRCVTDMVVFCNGAFEIYDYVDPINCEGVDTTFFRELANKHIEECYGGDDNI